MNEEIISELELRIASAPNQIEKVDAMNLLAFEIRNTNTQRSRTISIEAGEISDKINYSLGKATALKNEAFSHVQITNYEYALEKLFEALKIFEEEKNELGIAQVHYNFCMIYSRISDFNNSLESISKTVSYYQKENNISEIARCYFQMGHLYRSLNDFSSAIEYHKQGIELSMQIKDSAGEGASLMGLGLVYLITKEYEKCNECLQKSLKIQERIKDWRGYAASLNAYMGLCEATEKFEEAEQSAIEGIRLANELGDKMGVSRATIGLAKIYFKEHKIDLAEEKAIEGLEIASKMNLNMAIGPSHLLLSEIYEKKSDFKKALYHHQQYYKVNDEVAKTNTAMKAKSIQFVSKIENAQQEAEINRLKNVELKNAFNEIEEKNKEITDSITYALRIQSAILPSQKTVTEYLGDAFVLYKPKAIVAGDFYWLEKVDDTILFAACDCTGHGVPGAMVSVVCHNALNRAVREFGLTEPAAILDKTAEIVIENFSKSEENIKDGMDISLCAYNSKTKTIHWAGANNPIWIIQKGELIETKADKQPIGMNEHGKPFTNHCFNVSAGDIIYLFTDGYTDQFGGENGNKKLSRKRFKELLLTIQDQSMCDQGKTLDKFILDYKKELEQIDDILVIGVKI